MNIMKLIVSIGKQLIHLFVVHTSKVSHKTKRFKRQTNLFVDRTIKET